MQYLLLIYENESARPTDVSEEDQKAMFGRYYALNEEMRAAGVWVGGDALQPTSTATTVRVRGDKRDMTDGPFAETVEQLGGYYLIDAPDLDAALGWAAKIPAAETGSVEVRPVMILP